MCEYIHVLMLLLLKGLEDGCEFIPKCREPKESDRKTKSYMLHLKLHLKLQS